MRRVFIDTNVYLSFYRLASDDLEELRKLTALLKTGELSLYMTQQLRDEFLRNREKVLADSLKRVREMKVPSAFPPILRNYPRFKKVDSSRKEFSDLLDDLIKTVTEDAVSQSLHADKLLAELFDQADDLEETDEVFAAAKERMDRGNPPGKSGSYGDAISWEAVLAHHPVDEDLDLITIDGDYVSPLSADRLHEFLEREWAREKRSKVHVYESMRSFFSLHYPNIKLSEEVEAEVAVSRLIGSENFEATHKAIAALNRIHRFSDEQVVAIVKGALSNSQVTWILRDPDVYDFFQGLIREYGDVIGQAEVKRLREEMAK